MQKLHFSTTVKAPREKVWNTMLGDATYRQWTEPFGPGGYYEGSWEKGTEMKFLGVDPEKGKTMGMYSRIKENRPFEFISIEHLGIIENGVVDTESEKVKKWVPAFENYTFTKKDGETEVSVDVDVDEEYKAMFEEMWPKALAALKELAEK